jgi:hypothetical protein
MRATLVAMHPGFRAAKPRLVEHGSLRRSNRCRLAIEAVDFVIGHDAAIDSVVLIFGDFSVGIRPPHPVTKVTRFARVTSFDVPRRWEIKKDLPVCASARVSPAIPQPKCVVEFQQT